jgi:hypothetical protein
MNVDMDPVNLPVASKCRDRPRKSVQSWDRGIPRTRIAPKTYSRCHARIIAKMGRRKKCAKPSGGLLNWDRRARTIMLGLMSLRPMAGVRSLRDLQRIADIGFGFVRGLARAAADQGLGPTFLNETALLVENSAIPGDFAAPAIPARFQGLDPRDPVERVAEDDRVMEFPFEDGQKRQGIDSRGLAHQAGGDRQTEKSMSDRPAKRAEFGRDVIHVDWVKISGESREQDNIRLGHRPTRALPLIADDEVIK